MHIHSKSDEHHRQSTRGSALGHTASEGSALRGIRLRHLSQGHSGKDGPDRDRGKAGELAFRLRGGGETGSQWPGSAAPREVTTQQADPAAKPTYIGFRTWR